MVKIANNTSLYQLGWYMHKVMQEASVEICERVLLPRLIKFRPDLVDEIDNEDRKYLPGNKKDYCEKLKQLKNELKKYTSPPPCTELYEQNVLYIRDEFKLDAIDTEILLLILRCEVDSMNSFVMEIFRRSSRLTNTIASLIGISTRECQKRLSQSGTLISCGILINTNGDRGLEGMGGCDGHFRMSGCLYNVIHSDFSSREELVGSIFQQPLSTPLMWENFEHLGKSRDLAARVIADATKSKTKGINILLYGPVGTGKTEFCKALAEQTKSEIWSVGETDNDGGEPTRRERLSSLRLAQKLIGKRSQALILFDEAEDILVQSENGGLFGSDKSSKVFANRLIENNSVPVLWTCNDVHAIDPAVLRRMTLALELGIPNRQVSKRIWKNVLADAKIDISTEAINRFSTHYKVPPAVAASAARTAALVNGGEIEIEEAMSGVLQVIGMASCPPEIDGSSFDTALMNCSNDLSILTDRLTSPSAARNWSLCLYGAPGTGKSLFARHLADRLGLEVMQERASTLLSKWVGDSEKQIAKAFATARRKGAMLIIDEADSFLSDRRDASHNWEVTQVNEMLTWMENHPLPFVCTTNLMERLDPASLRRFTLKLRFNSLDPKQAMMAFERFFALPAPLQLPNGLTPGDFATVRRKRELLGDADCSHLILWLREEVEAKGLRGDKIGFLPQAA